MLRISYIQPLYHVPDKIGHINHVAAEKEHKEHLKDACEKRLENGGLLATYIPIGINSNYGLNHLKGKVTTLLKPIPMPESHDMTDYNHINSLNGINKWPYGWPLKVVCTLPTEKCPKLKYIIESINGPNTFQNWTKQFSSTKPAKLFKDESKALQTFFEPFFSFN